MMINLTHIHVGWPQGIMLVLFLLALTRHALKDGERQEGNYNFAATFLAQLVILILLLLGGFFGNIFS